MSVLPGPVRQNGYVVRDLDAAMAAWLALGVGPWFKLSHMRPPNMRYAGRPVELSMSIALANSGDLQLELIQQDDATPSVYTDFLESGREGFHHLAWWADDFDGVMQRADAAGWSVVQEGGGDGIPRFAYFDLGGTGGTVIELMELNDMTRWLGDTVRQGAEAWNGTDEPIRSLF